MHSTIIKLKNYKETKNLTNKTLAEALGVAKITVSSWFRGVNTPRGETLNMIEKFLETKSTSVQGKTEIVKLTDPEDILSALQNGETLIANDYRIAFENGILIKRTSKGNIYT